MWNMRYSVLPVNPNGWNDETRAYAAFVTDAERITRPAMPSRPAGWA